MNNRTNIDEARKLYSNIRFVEYILKNNKVGNHEQVRKFVDETKRRLRGILRCMCKSRPFRKYEHCCPNHDMDVYFYEVYLPVGFDKKAARDYAWNEVATKYEYKDRDCTGQWFTMEIRIALKSKGLDENVWLVREVMVRDV